MNVVVIGDSVTNPGASADRRPWTALLAEQAGPSVEVEAFLFWPVGAGAAEFAMRRVRALEPDVVLLTINSYPCAVGLVSERLRGIAGGRVGSAFASIERRVHVRRGGRTGGVQRLARKAARRIVGTSTIATPEAVGATYADLIGRLATLEGVGIHVFGAPRFGPEVRAANPSLDAVVARLQEPVVHAAAAHRIPFADIDPVFRPQGSRAWMPDNVHFSAHGNALYATEVRRLLASELALFQAQPLAVSR